MKYSLLGISVSVLISAFMLPSCSKEEYTPLPVSSKSCNIRIECVGTSGENLLADKSFIDRIKIVGENSHTDIKFTVRNSYLCFEADLPDQNDMKWSNDRHDATGMSRMTVSVSKQKIALKCFLKYMPNRPPATVGGSLSLEEVEYNGRTYKRSGNAVTFRIQFNWNGSV